MSHQLKTIGIGMIALATVLISLSPGSSANAAQAQKGPDAVASSAVFWQAPVNPAFKISAKKYDVPIELLLVLGDMGSGLDNRGDSPSIEGGYGLMGLRENDWGGDSLALAVELLNDKYGKEKVDSYTLKLSPRLNVLGAAAVLNAYADEEKIDRDAGLEAWLPVVIRYAGLTDEGCNKLFARTVYRMLGDGFTKTNSYGETFSVEPQEVKIDLDSLYTPEIRLMAAPSDCGYPDYASAIWEAAASCNYSTTYTEKDTVIVHVAQGSAAGTISWFRNCDSGVSTQYVVDTDGTVYQMVCEKMLAYHVPCVNSRCIGIEHAGYISDTHTEAMYQGAADLVRDICNRWSIPKTHNRQPPGVVGHDGVTECLECGSHLDPGHNWEWGHFMALVNQTTDPTEHIVESRSGGLNNAGYSEVGTFGNSTGKSTIYGTTAGIGSRYAYMNGTNRATYSFTPTTTGSYKVYVTWPNSTNATQSLKHTVTHAGGSTDVMMDLDADTNPCGRNWWNLLGTFTLNASTAYSVTQTSVGDADGAVLRADSVKWVLEGSAGNDAPTITSHPEAQTVAAGAAATFTVGASGSPTLTYQWQKNSSNLSDGGDISGATTATLQIANCESADAGNYRCVVTNSYGSATSNTAALTITTGAVEYLVECRSGGSNYSSFSMEGAWAQSTYKSSAEDLTSGIGSLYTYLGYDGREATYSFTPTTTGTYEIFVTWVTSANACSSAKHVITHAGGSTTKYMNQLANGNTWVSMGEYELHGGNEYTVTQYSAGSTGGTIIRSDAILWELVSSSGGSAPTITQQPEGQTVQSGQTATFTVTAVGDGTPTYQWQKDQSNLSNGGDISGATSDTLEIANVESADEGDYRCVVTNSYGSTNSNEASLTVSTSAPGTEFRGVWADVWHTGYKSAADIDNLVARAKAGGYNAIFPEVLGYHDNASNAHGAYWDSEIIPMAPDISGGIDPLAYLVSAAHAEGIEVHCWLTPFRACLSWPPANNAILTEHPEWVMVEKADMNTGPKPIDTDYTLDVGSPDVQDYLISIMRELVTNYEIDGIHWDRIRYHQTDAGYPAYSSYARSGLARFKAIESYTGTPDATGNTDWDNFRRRTITEFIRRAQVEIESITTNPRQPLRHSVAVVTWGDAPASFSTTSSYELFQDWEDWADNGYVDMTIPMTYYDEDSYPTWYRNWVDKSLVWGYDRHMVIGPALYLNDFADSVTQSDYALDEGADGVCHYAYALTRYGANYDWTWYTYAASNLFTSAAQPPTMPWRDSSTATEGRIWGQVTDADSGEPIDNATVQVGAMTAVKTDGNGYYVVTEVTAGSSGTNYTVTASQTDYTTVSYTVTAERGMSVRADFSLQGQADPIYIVECRSGGLHFSNVTVTGAWAESASKSSADGLTSGIGSLYTYPGYSDRYITYNFTPTQTGLYEVFATWVTSANASSSVKHTVTHAGGSATSYENQLTTGDEWVSLGEFTLNSGTGYSVTQYSDGTTGGTLLRSDAIKWVYLGGGTGTPPTIAVNPTNKTVQQGETVTFTVSANGSTPLSYQWQKDGSDLSNGGDISGAMTVTLSIANAALEDEGGYRCVVSNAYGTATSASALLDVTTAVGGTTYVDDDFDDYANQAALEAVWTESVGTTALSTTRSYSGAKSIYISTAGGRCDLPFTGVTPVDSNPLEVSYRYYDDNANNLDRQYIQLMAYNSTPTLTQIIALGACNTDNAMRDYYATWVAFSPGAGYLALNDTGAPERSIGWHELKMVIYSTTIDFYVDGTLAKAGVTYASNEGDHEFNEIRIGSGLSSTSAAYYDDMLIEDLGDGSPSGPEITGQPENINICPGSTANFTVTAAGVGTVSYQWQKDGSNLSNGGDISGATAATLEIANVESADADNYRCAVTDDNGTTNSDNAALSVKTATSISSHPSNEVVSEGETAYFSVTAAGEGTLTYQWKKGANNLSDGGDISGATTATLSIANAEDADEDNYSCVVTGGCGSLTSNSASLTVSAATAVLEDDFDDYANQTAFAAVWSDVYGTVTLSTSAYYSSPNSVYIGTAAGRRGQDFTDAYGTTSNPLELSFRYYDNSAYNLDRQCVQLYAHDEYDALTQIVCLGTNNNDYDMRDYYAARVAYSPGPGWVVLDDAGAPERSIGWHELKAVFKSTTIDFYVDGTLAKSGVSYSSSEGDNVFDEARIGSGYSSTSAAYYDDFSLTGGE